LETSYEGLPISAKKVKKFLIFYTPADIGKKSQIKNFIYIYLPISARISAS